MNREKWINEVLDSTRGMQPAQPPARLFEKITDEINNPKKYRQANTVPFPVKQWAVAAMLLLAVNIGSVLYYIGENKKAAISTRTTLLTDELQAQSTYNY